MIFSSGKYVLTNLSAVVQFFFIEFFWDVIGELEGIIGLKGL